MNSVQVKASILALPLALLAIPNLANAETMNWQAVVNTNADTIQADNFLSLREAIAAINGSLPMEELSEAERQQLTPGEGNSRIEFNLSPQKTTINLVGLLPPLSTPGLVIDGTSQPGYDREELEKQGGATPIPVVAITPATESQVLRGLTIVADGVTVRGLSVYGFSYPQGPTANTPTADIFISHRLPPPDTFKREIPYDEFSFSEQDVPPQDVVIEHNWLGVPSGLGTDSRFISQIDRSKNEVARNAKPQEFGVTDSLFVVPTAAKPQSPQPDSPAAKKLSGFGVYVFNSKGTTIHRNIIANHDGSGIITSVRAKNLLVRDNLIERNGFAGMPDGIRLEGDITDAMIQGNLIRNNAGSGIFAFKPTGAVEIRDNNITDNGKRYERAAIYLSGSDHLITRNRIANQPGTGVTVAAFPESDRVVILNNLFTGLQGLSIDLVAQNGTEVKNYQKGDGPNPEIEFYQRRRQAA
ncbi:MAG: right-handed parallel beta-helix repeat-containing protein, partial [Spirulinaceae cyanobacterium]